MDSSTIKFKTIQEIQGIKHIPSEMVNSLKRIMCDRLKVERNQENFEAVEDGVRTYFKLQNKRCKPW